LIVGEEITSNEKEFTSCEQISDTHAMTFKFEAPPTNSSAGLTFKPSTPSRGVFTFCQSSHPSNNNNDSGLSNMMSTLDVSDNKTNKSMAILDNMSICASCGKEGNYDDMNTCNKCQVVKYWNAALAKRGIDTNIKMSVSFEECVRLATEKHNEDLRLAAELHDEKLFKQSLPRKDCPICFLLLPTLSTGSKYMACCGKLICGGCDYAPVYDNQGNKIAKKVCAFCRAPWHASNNEFIERMKKREEADDAQAIFNRGCYYRDGQYGVSQDYTKALKLWYRAAELGSAKAYNDIGYAYSNGKGVEVDKKKAKHYYEIGAMGGNASARYNLGNDELRAGNMNRALKHYMIGVECGHHSSLEEIKKLYAYGFATKKDYAKALQAYQEYLGEIKSAHRDKAAAFHEEYRYY